MVKDLIHNRIKETNYNIFPLNRLLPQFSVFNIFKQNYDKERKKICFFNNHQYLKLREGYFAMFACKAFDEIEKREHFLIFSDEEKGDVALCAYRKDKKMDYFQCDVKEYHPKDSNTFEGFLNQILSKPKILQNQYGLIIGFHRNALIDRSVVSKLELIQKRLSRGVFLISNISEDSSDPYQSRVIYLNEGYRFDKQVEINNRGIDEILIYQDVINFD